MLVLSNSLSRTKEKFQAKTPGQVKLYVCGPTVYDYVTIGNWRTYVLGDLVVRTLKQRGYKVRYIMNITDVGHLTGDNLGDASMGEDRLEKGAKREGKNVWDVAKFYENDFKQGYKLLNLTQPDKFTRATDYMQAQIDLGQKIEKKGFTYKIKNDGIYFDVKAYEKAGNQYGVLSTLDQRQAGARVAFNRAKKDPRDFALWKFSPQDKQRQMEWDSPWGKGFPGWHIECSAMCMQELGEQIDIHIGGEDLRSTHHPNEIAQSEVATGKKPFVRYWLHGAFLQVDGGRMGKSLGNAYTLHDIIKKGFDPMALRYFYLNAHYHKKLNFTWKALKSAQRAYLKLLRAVSELKKENKNASLSSRAQLKKKAFNQALEDDLNMPPALAETWLLLKDKQISDADKNKLIIEWDKVLGLGLNGEVKSEKVPKDIKDLAKKRQSLRKKGKYQEADKLREKIEKKGYFIKDSTDGSRIIRK